MSTADPPWQLWSTDLFDREAAPTLECAATSLRGGLATLWAAVLSQGVQDDGRPTFTDFSLRSAGQPAVSLTRDPLMNPELAQLRARLGEHDFTYRLAVLHESLREQPFSFAPFLAMPVALPGPVTRVAEVLAATLGEGLALTAVAPGWRCGERVQIVTSGYLAGNCFESPQTRWTVRAEGVVVTLDDIAEVGWCTATSSDGSAAASVLRDALLAAGLS